MKTIADLHIHSRFSRATSKEGTPEHLDLWARKKGISLIGTGDFTHPEWRKELEEKLEPAQDGLYKLKKENVLEESGKYAGEDPRFVISGEISSIYKKNGKVRKVHNVILLPGLEEGEKLSKKLESIGNIHSDGRPILGLDCRELLEILLDITPKGILVPAHIWTPHFSLFGAFSGFDSIEECFEDLTPYIHALETGLSSDPPMNWRWSALDRFQLISNSDAHSPGKLGREANLLDIDLSYEGLYSAVQEGTGLLGTIEFFPEEGKYHFDGHRKCHLCLSPREAEQYGGKCPVCGKKITIGVDHRIVQLADRKDGYKKENGLPYERLVPLLEVIGASLGHSSASRKVQEEYEKMLQNFGTEFQILREIPIEDLRASGSHRIAEGIRRLREGQVERSPGFDGEYGTIRLFRPDELANPEGQMSFFTQRENTNKELPSALKHTLALEKNDKDEEKERLHQTDVLNVYQKEAVEAIDRVIMVIAGPGTGKTKTLVTRLKYLLEMRKVKPSEITAVTFTNQAAGELKERLTGQTDSRRNLRKLQIGTFHSICMEFLKKQGKTIYLAQESELQDWAEEICQTYGLSISKRKFLSAVSAWKTGDGKMSGEEEREILLKAFQAYEDILKKNDKWDFDDLLLQTISVFEQMKEKCAKDRHAVEKAFTYLLVDEFQDISPLQYKLIQTWNQHGKELFVIGDPDQSIYGFRGADAACFEKLKDKFPDARVITLIDNYRSTEKIVRGAIGAISHNPGRQRILTAYKKEGKPIRVVCAESKMSEAVFVAKEITRLIGGIDMLDVDKQEMKNETWKNRTFRDIAVLYRSHHQARLLEKCLTQEGIPYVVCGKEEFLSEDFVRGTISFFLSLLYPENIGYQQEAQKRLWGSLGEKMSENFYGMLEKKYQEKWNKTKSAKLMKEWGKDLGKEEDRSFCKLSGMAVLYEKLPEFLNALLTGEEGDIKRCNGKILSGDAVRLMSIHGSKGLEFPVTILYGMGKGELPLESEKYPVNIEEERRLLFVAMTRAKEELILTYSDQPSLFLKEIPEVCMEKERAGRKKSVENMKQMSLFDFI